MSLLPKPTVLPFAFLLCCFLLITCNPNSQNEETKIVFDVSIQILGEGTVTPNAGSFDAQTNIKLKATPAVGFYFDRWEGLDQAEEKEEVDLLLSRDFSLRAIFLPLPKLSEEVLVFAIKKMDPNPVFMIENGGTTAYLTDKSGMRLQTWDFDSRLGNEVKLLEDGSVIGIFKPETVSFSFGGYGGILKKYNPAGDLVWEYAVHTEKELSHHDFAVLPNGNIVLLVWEAYTTEEARQLGYDGLGPIYLEKLIEVEPQTKAVVWEWKSADHLIQDFDPAALNFGTVADHPEKIDLNYLSAENGDLMHANGLYYDASRDVIFLSVNFYSEIWVIPHQYDRENTKTDLGDLVYRFGNPRTYKGDGERLFYNNHHPSIVELDPETAGHFLVFMNGSQEKQSVVYEFLLPNTFSMDPHSWDSPEIVWSFTDKDLFFSRISGAYRLPNGNTLICEGDFGYWEVTPQGEIVWKYQGEVNFWRGYVYP